MSMLISVVGVVYGVRKVFLVDYTSRCASEALEGPLFQARAFNLFSFFMQLWYDLYSMFIFYRFFPVSCEIRIMFVSIRFQYLYSQYFYYNAYLIVGALKYIVKEFNICFFFQQRGLLNVIVPYAFLYFSFIIVDD